MNTSSYVKIVLWKVLISPLFTEKEKVLLVKKIESWDITLSIIKSLEQLIEKQESVMKEYFSRYVDTQMKNDIDVFHLRKMIQSVVLKKTLKNERFWEDDELSQLLNKIEEL